MLRNKNSDQKLNASFGLNMVSICDFTISRDSDGAVKINVWSDSLEPLTAFATGKLSEGRGLRGGKLRVFREYNIVLTRTDADKPIFTPYPGVGYSFNVKAGVKTVRCLISAKNRKQNPNYPIQSVDEVEEILRTA